MNAFISILQQDFPPAQFSTPQDAIDFMDTAIQEDPTRAIYFLVLLDAVGLVDLTADEDTIAVVELLRSVSDEVNDAGFSDAVNRLIAAVLDNRPGDMAAAGAGVSGSSTIGRIAALQAIGRIELPAGGNLAMRRSKIDSEIRAARDAKLRIVRVAGTIEHAFDFAEFVAIVIQMTPSEREDLRRTLETA
jgi:hypothetical protein